jgi:hypothetical protein
MISRPVLIGLLAAACITAAAGGAFVAIRQNAGDRASAANTATAVREATQPANPAQPVAETEAVVSPPASQPAAAPAQPAPSVAAPAEAQDDRSNSKVETRSKRARAPIARAERPAASRVGSEPDARSNSGQDPRSTSSQASRRPTDPASASPAGAGDPNVVREAPSAGAPTAEATTAERGRATEVVPSAPEPKFVEVVLPASSVIGLQMETSTSSETAGLEDRVEARVTRDVIASGRTAILAGSKLIGSVTLVERGGKIKEQARLNVRFHTLVLANGTELPLRTETITREGEAPSGDSSRKIGGAAVGGAILGAILGGGKGAMIGGATGAGAGTAAVMAGDRKAATLRSGETVTVKLSAPVNIEVEREQQ